MANKNKLLQHFEELERQEKEKEKFSPLPAIPEEDSSETGLSFVKGLKERKREKEEKETAGKEKFFSLAKKTFLPPIPVPTLEKPIPIPGEKEFKIAKKGVKFVRENPEQVVKALPALIPLAAGLATSGASLPVSVGVDFAAGGAGELARRAGLKYLGKEVTDKRDIQKEGLRNVAFGLVPRGARAVYRGVAGLTSRTAKFIGQILGIPKEASETVIKNPAALQKTFQSAKAFSKVADKAQKKLQNAQNKISEDYKNFYVFNPQREVPSSQVKELISKAEGELGLLGQGKMPSLNFKELSEFKDIVKDFNKAVLELQNKEGRVKEIVKESISPVGELAKETSLQFVPNPNPNLGAQDIHALRKRLDSVLNNKGISPEYAGRMKQLRTSVDDILKKHYPIIKKIDADKEVLERTKEFFKRYYGLEPSKIKSTPIQTVVLEQKAKQMFGGVESTKELTTALSKKIKIKKLPEELKNLAAAQFFVPGGGLFLRRAFIKTGLGKALQYGGTLEKATQKAVPKIQRYAPSVLRLEYQKRKKKQ